MSGMMSRFHYLDLGLAAILVFIGLKMMVAKWLHVPNLLSLGVIAGVLTTAIVVSLLRPPKETEPVPSVPPSGSS